MNTKQIEVLKLALEALEQMQAMANFDCWNLDICDEAITAIREALAEQPAQQRQIDPKTRTRDGLKYSPSYVVGYNDGLKAAQQQEPVAWRELCHRLYVELFHCDQQMMATLDEDGEPVWTQGKTVRDVLADAKAALETSPPAQQEPVAWRVQRNDGEYELYFHKPNAERAAECYTKRPPVEPLYTSPPASKPLTDAQIGAVAADIWGSVLIAPQSYQAFARAIEAAHGIKGDA